MAGEANREGFPTAMGRLAGADGRGGVVEAGRSEPLPHRRRLFGDLFGDSDPDLFREPDLTGGANA